MVPSKLLVFAITIFIISTFCPTTSSSRHSSSSSIYDVLRSHGLPIGLIPKGVTNFTVDPLTGHFEVHLEQSCDAKFETHVRYDWNVSGTLSYGQIFGMSGVAAQDLFLWFPVKGIRVDIPSSGLIYFDVGVVFKQFSLSFFETPRDCTVTDSTSHPTDLIIFNDHGQIVQNQPGNPVNELGQGNVWRSVS